MFQYQKLLVAAREEKKKKEENKKNTTGNTAKDSKKIDNQSIAPPIVNRKDSNTIEETRQISQSSRKGKRHYENNCTTVSKPNCEINVPEINDSKEETTKNKLAKKDDSKLQISKNRLSFQIPKKSKPLESLNHSLKNVTNLNDICKPVNKKSVLTSKLKKNAPAFDLSPFVNKTSTTKIETAERTVTSPTDSKTKSTMLTATDESPQPSFLKSLFSFAKNVVSTVTTSLAIAPSENPPMTVSTDIVLPDYDDYTILEDDNAFEKKHDMRSNISESTSYISSTMNQPDDRNQLDLLSKYDSNINTYTSPITSGRAFLNDSFTKPYFESSVKAPSTRIQSTAHDLPLKVISNNYVPIYASADTGRVSANDRLARLRDNLKMQQKTSIVVTTPNTGELKKEIRPDDDDISMTDDEDISNDLSDGKNCYLHFQTTI